MKAPDLTPAPVIPRGLPEAELIAYIAEAKYLLGEPLYRMEQHFKMQGIYLNRTSLANWIIKSSEWLIPVVKHFWKYAYLEPVLNADETTLRVLKIHGKPVKKGEISAWRTALPYGTALQDAGHLPEPHITCKLDHQKFRMAYTCCEALLEIRLS